MKLRYTIYCFLIYSTLLAQPDSIVRYRYNFFTTHTAREHNDIKVERNDSDSTHFCISSVVNKAGADVHNFEFLFYKLPYAQSKKPQNSIRYENGSTNCFPVANGRYIVIATRSVGYSSSKFRLRIRNERIVLRLIAGAKNSQVNYEIRSSRKLAKKELRALKECLSKDSKCDTKKYCADCQIEMTVFG